MTGGHCEDLSLCSFVAVGSSPKPEEGECKTEQPWHCHGHRADRHSTTTTAEVLLRCTKTIDTLDALPDIVAMPVAFS